LADNSQPVLTNKSQPRRSQLSTGIGWLLSNLAGLTAILIVIGYLVHWSKERLIGFPIDAQIPSDFILAAVNLIGDTLVSVVDWHVLVGALLLCIAVLVLNRRSTHLRWRLIFVIVVCLAKIFLLDAPSLYLKDVMVTAPSYDETLASGIMMSGTSDLWHDFYCAHHGAQGAPCGYCKAASYHQEKLREYLGLDLVLLAAAVWVAWPILSGDNLSDLRYSSQILIKSLLSSFLVVSICLLPVRYGTTLSDNQYLQVMLVLTGPPQPYAQPVTQSQSQTLQNANGSTVSALSITASGLLFSQNNDGVLLWQFGNKSFDDVNFFPNDKIQRINYDLSQEYLGAFDTMVAHYGSCAAD